ILEINKIRENPEPNIVFPYRQNSIVPLPDDPTGRSEPGAQHPTTYLRGLTELFQDVNLFTGRCRCPMRRTDGNFVYEESGGSLRRMGLLITLSGDLSIQAKLGDSRREPGGP